MITIRCTAKAARHLRVTPIPDAPPGTSLLGDWYVNLVPTYGGELLLFVSERSLVSVCVPTFMDHPFNVFYHRVANLLALRSPCPGGGCLRT